MKKYKYCQSCGMPMKKDPEGGGANADGSKSEKYCSYCYKEGKFIGDIKTAEEMKKFVDGKLKEMKLPKFMRWFFTRNIPKLERWQ